MDPDVLITHLLAWAEWFEHSPSAPKDRRDSKNLFDLAEFTSFFEAFIVKT